MRVFVILVVFSGVFFECTSLEKKDEPFAVYSGIPNEKLGFYEGILVYTFEGSGFVFMDNVGITNSIFFPDFLKFNIDWNESLELKKRINSRQGRKYNFAHVKFKGYINENRANNKEEVVVVDVHEMMFLTGKHLKKLVYDKHIEYSKN